MTLAEYLYAIIDNKNTIRTKLVSMGLAASTDNLETLAEIINDLIDNGALNLTVKEGDTVTIPAGFHNGSGTVSGISGGGGSSYTLQAKVVTPTKKQQNVTTDAGYYGLSIVTVNAIPEAFQDVSSVTATAPHVLAGDIFVDAVGTVTEGSMPDNGSVVATIDGLTTTSYRIPAGCHDGNGTVTLTDDIEKALAAL